TPRSRARFTIGRALSISTIHSSELPKDIVPRQMRETSSPVKPSRVYSIELLPRTGRLDSPVQEFQASDPLMVLAAFGTDDPAASREEFLHIVRRSICRGYERGQCPIIFNISQGGEMGVALCRLERCFRVRVCLVGCPDGIQLRSRWRATGKGAVLLVESDEECRTFCSEQDAVQDLGHNLLEPCVAD